jgi:hypothetical protein
MAVPNSRSALRDYCYRKLGFPVIEINVDPDQVEDRIDEAITLWQQFHYDAVNKVYAQRLITQDDINNRWIPLDPNVIGVTRIFTLSTSSVNSAGTSNFNMFDINYQIRLNELYDFTSADYVYFELANQHIRTLEMLFLGEVPIRFNRYDDKLWIDVDWGGKVSVGSYIIAEVYATLDPSNTLFWNDSWLKRYTTALIKRQWGENLKKFAGVQLPGGIALNGQQIWDEADKQCTDLEQELRDSYEMPPMFEVG